MNSCPGDGAGAAAASDGRRWRGGGGSGGASCDSGWRQRFALSTSPCWYQAGGLHMAVVRLGVGEAHGTNVGLGKPTAPV